MHSIIALIIAYLLGSLSTSVILSKLLNTPDPRTQGSKNAGATNTLRTAGKKQAALVLIGDILKGFIAVLIGHALGIHHFALGLVALAAVIGHVFPVFFNFKGGKGVATAVGSIFGLSLLAGTLTAAVWILIAYLSKYASLASLIAVILAPLFLLFFGQAAFFTPTIFVALLVIWKHKDNIIRLQNRTENKIKI